MSRSSRNNTYRRARYVGAGRSNLGDREDFPENRVTEREAMHNPSTNDNTESPNVRGLLATARVYGLCFKNVCGEAVAQEGMNFCPFKENKC